MKQKQVVIIGLIVAMLACALILVIGDLGAKTPKETVISSVTSAVTVSGIELTIAGTRTSCESISSWHQAVQGSLIAITPVFARLPDASCDELVAFQELVMVPIESLPAGTYTVDVTGIVSQVVIEAPVISNETPEDVIITDDASINE